MALSQTATGTQAATPGTDHTLSTQTASNVYQGRVNITNLAAGEYVEIWAESNVDSPDSVLVVWKATFSWLHAAPIVETPPIPCPHDFELHLKQIGGSSRNFDWSVYEYE